MYIVKKTLEISASHHLNLSYESKCSSLHGHNWIISIFCRAETLNQDGMVTDFSLIKKLIHEKLDHKNLNEIYHLILLPRILLVGYVIKFLFAFG